MKNYSDFLKDFEKLISINSVKDAPEERMPFGKGVNQAFNEFKSICSRLGFSVTDYDGYFGEFSVGEGEEVGVIGHLDVVPAPENGWNTPPFKLTKKNGVFYGRGVSDDKGPLIVALYALKELIADGAILKKKLRFFIGLDEESGWADVDYFLTKNTFPKYGFSPDGNFPVTYAEKGPNSIKFFIPYDGKTFTMVKGGTVVNAVCDYATAVGKIDEDLLKKYGLMHNGSMIISHGKSAHGSKPELGVNAIKPLLGYMNEIENGRFNNAIECLFNDKYGITKMGNETGLATLSPDVIDFDGENIVITADFRVPAKMNLTDFLPYFDRFDIKYIAKKSRDPLFVEKDSELVTALINAYNEVTGENAVPETSTGATFSSVFECGAAFGPEFKDADGAIHEPNEYLSEENLLKMFNIYKTAFKNLLT